MHNPSYLTDSLSTIPPASMPAQIQALTGILKTDLDKVFLVGGCVRDILAGKAPEDIDLLAVLPPKRLLDLGCTYVDPKTTIPVFTMHRGDLGKIEIALPRGKESGPGAMSDVREDLRRRDFTINAMACRLSTGELIDPFNGRQDLKDRTIRHVSEAFAEDPLRVFRAFRFACKGFTIAPETMDLIRTMDPELEHIPPERIYNEMMKAMAEERPERFFIYLVKSGVSKDVFREIYRMLDVQPRRQRPQVRGRQDALQVHAPRRLPA